MSGLLVPVMSVYLLPSLLLTAFAATINDINGELRMTDIGNALHDLPFGPPPNMLEDLPGAPLSPTDFAYILPAKDIAVDANKEDPIELARAFEGDIVFANFAELTFMTQPPQNSRGANQRNAVIQPDRIWPNKEIPYVISSSYTNEERGTIAVAMRNFHLQTCLKLVPRDRQKDYIHLHKGQGCSSSVGRVGGHQSVSLGPGCLYVGIVMHELMHAAGFWHEQSRFDRDDYVRIFWDNIKNGMEFNFQKYDWKTIAHLDMKYDLASILHYGDKSFAKDRSRKTIESINGQEIGQRRAFSPEDVKKINKLYKCHETGTSYMKVTTSKPTTTGGGHGGGGNSGCKDNYDVGNCLAWSKAGQCELNPDWMLPNCKKSCNNCEDACTDLNANCPYWSKIKECTSNTAYMHQYCKKSCGLCHALHDDTDECVDKNEYCLEWAAKGTCHTNTPYMVSYCKQSCTDCQPMNPKDLSGGGGNSLF